MHRGGGRQIINQPPTHLTNHVQYSTPPHSNPLNRPPTHSTTNPLNLHTHTHASGIRNTASLLTCYSLLAYHVQCSPPPLILCTCRTNTATYLLLPACRAATACLPTCYCLLAELLLPACQPATACLPSCYCLPAYLLLPACLAR